MNHQAIYDKLTEYLDDLHEMLPEDARVAFIAYVPGDEGFELLQTDGDFDELIAAIEACRENELRSVN